MTKPPRSTVYTLGCWDLLHPGHIAHLKTAHQMGSHLTVGLYTDKVIKSYKGKEPVMSVEERQAMLCAVRYVDKVVVVSSRYGMGVLRRIKPYIMAVGQNWSTTEPYKHIERYLKGIGSRIVRVPYSPSISTTDIMNRIAWIRVGLDEEVQ